MCFFTRGSDFGFLSRWFIEGNSWDCTRGRKRKPGHHLLSNCLNLHNENI